MAFGAMFQSPSRGRGSAWMPRFGLPSLLPPLLASVVLTRRPSSHGSLTPMSGLPFSLGTERDFRECVAPREHPPTHTHTVPLDEGGSWAARAAEGGEQDREASQKGGAHPTPLVSSGSSQGPLWGVLTRSVRCMVIAR